MWESDDVADEEIMRDGDVEEGVAVLPKNIVLKNWIVCPTNKEPLGVFVEGKSSDLKVCCSLVQFFFVCDECVGCHYDWSHCIRCKQKEDKGRQGSDLYSV